MLNFLEEDSFGNSRPISLDEDKIHSSNDMEALFDSVSYIKVFIIRKCEIKSHIRFFLIKRLVV
jgi:hypothetical protein